MAGTAEAIKEIFSQMPGQINPDELWSLYQKETNKELKMQMVSLFGSMDAADHLNRIVTTEKDAVRFPPLAASFL